MTLEEYIEAEPSPSGQLRRRYRIFLANLAVALGWALKRSCKGCAHRLFATARWLVPEAELSCPPPTLTQSPSPHIQFYGRFGRPLEPHAAS